jgi:hypothetical protein
MDVLLSSRDSRSGWQVMKLFQVAVIIIVSNDGWMDGGRVNSTSFLELDFYLSNWIDCSTPVEKKIL